MAQERRKQRGSMILALVSVLATLAGLEILIRVTGLYERTLQAEQVVWSSEFHHSYQPDSQFIRYPNRYEQLDFGPVQNEINAIGMRGPLPTVEQVDILLLGDSFIQADEIPYEQTIAPRLEHLLGQGTVIGHGISSWSPLLEWNWYLKIGQQFSPRRVFLFIVINDFYAVDEYDTADPAYLEQVNWTDAGRPASFNVQDSTLDGGSLQMVQLLRLALFRMRQPNSTVPARGFSSQPTSDALGGQEQVLFDRALEQAGGFPLMDSDDLANLFALPDAAFRALFEGRSPAIEGYWSLERPMSLWTGDIHARLAVSEEILGHFADDVALNGGELLLVYVPSGLAVSPEECLFFRPFYGVEPGASFPEITSGIRAWLAGAAERLGLPLLDPTDTLRTVSAGGEELLYLRYDCHWSAAGHAEMAQYLAEWISENSR